MKKPREDMTKNNENTLHFLAPVGGRHVQFIEDIIAGRIPGARAENKSQAIRLSLELAEDVLRGRVET